MNDYLKTYDFYMMRNISNLVYYDCRNNKLCTMDTMECNYPSRLLEHNIIARNITDDIRHNFLSNEEIKSVLPTCQSNDIILFFNYGSYLDNTNLFDYLVVDRDRLTNLFSMNNEIIVTRVLGYNFIFSTDLHLYSVVYKIDKYSYSDSFEWGSVEKISNLTKLLYDYDYDYLDRYHKSDETIKSYRLCNTEIVNDNTSYRYLNKYSSYITEDGYKNGRVEHILNINIDLIKYLDKSYQDLKDKYNIAEYYYEDYIRLKFLEFKPKLLRYISSLDWADVTDIAIQGNNGKVIDISKFINKLIKKNLTYIFYEIIKVYNRANSFKVDSTRFRVYSNQNIKDRFNKEAYNTIDELNRDILPNSRFDKYRVVVLSRKQLDRLYNHNILPFYQLVVNELMYIFKGRLTINNDYIFNKLNSLYSLIIHEFNYEILGYAIAIRELDKNSSTKITCNNSDLDKYINGEPMYTKNIKYGLPQLFEIEFSKFKSKLGEARYCGDSREIYGKESITSAFDNFFISTDSDISTWKGDITEADRLYVNCINEGYYTSVNDVYKLDETKLYNLFKSKLYTSTITDGYTLYDASRYIKFTLSNKIWITPTNSIEEGRFYFIHEQCGDIVKICAIGSKLDSALEHLVEYNQRG